MCKVVPVTFSIFQKPLLNVPGEVESQASGAYSFWPTEATKCLIATYSLYEDELESNSFRKKDVWQKIMMKMHDAGFKYSVTKIESKWRNLVKSHKQIIDNKKKTDGKRRNFQYFEEINDILSKRHDINPTSVCGLRLKLNSLSEKERDEETLDDTSTDNGSTNLSQTVSAKKRRENRRKLENSTQQQTLDLLKRMEEQRRIEYEERERKQEERAERRDRLLQKLIDKL